MSPDAYSAKVLTTLEAIARDVAELKGMLLVMSSGQRSGSSANGSSSGPRGDAPSIATDHDLDGEHGDPMIKYDPKPKYWSGDSFVGYRFSETSPEYLDATAKYLDACAYMFAKDPDEKKQKSATYKAKDAARARGWAARLRQGGGSRVHTQPSGGGTGAEDYLGGGEPTSSVYADDDIPFAMVESRWTRP